MEILLKVGSEIQGRQGVLISISCERIFEATFAVWPPVNRWLQGSTLVKIIICSVYCIVINAVLKIQFHETWKSVVQIEILHNLHRLVRFLMPLLLRQGVVLIGR